MKKLNELSVMFDKAETDIEKMKIGFQIQEQLNKFSRE